jgi:hypothetical protein
MPSTEHDRRLRAELADELGYYPANLAPEDIERHRRPNAAPDALPADFDDPVAYRGEGADPEGALIASGRYVCFMVDRGAAHEAITNYVADSQGYGPDDMYTNTFAALSIRTFCPPTPADRSWG